jgi:hypothetical protein
MVDLSVSGARTRREPSRVASALAFVSELLALTGAAVRAGRAVENHRAPHPRDLRMLGIERGLPPLR